MSKLKKNYFLNKRGGYNKQGGGGGLHVWLLLDTLGGIPFIQHQRVVWKLQFLGYGINTNGWIHITKHNNAS